ncbi:MAG: hypothetical protein KJ050_02270 [Candidatus Omnitrophica bacterium]|nr:hypothetical protein [bacterium]MBK7496661.1 hypothetical protein [Candidatus Omnitrophota bacterium]MCE7907675.1 hypothetical protein [Candidatus Omnitrophica bacterium COP1]MCK6497538.1 hypothetical protein [bacterium]MCL4733733.1 hypothetical protein [Candidatus Omnitrophota bacterium]
MNQENEERRVSDHRVMIVVSRDEQWLNFAEKTLRRTDQVKALHGLEGASEKLTGIQGTRFLLVSSELVPAKVKDFQAFLDSGRFERVCVLKEFHDEHQRISDKHLRELGIIVVDRPDNSKAFHRLLKMVCA